MTNDTDGIRRLSVAEAQQLIAAGQGVLVDTRGRHLYDNAHAAGAISVPFVAIEATEGRAAADAVPPDRVLIFYCA